MRRSPLSRSWRVRQNRLFRAVGVPVALATVALCAWVGLSGVDSALAFEQTPRWMVSAISTPTNFAPGPGGEKAYRIAVTNVGGAASDGSPITISDQLPAGLVLGGTASGVDQLVAATKPSLASANFTCTFASCTYSGVVVPDDTLIVTIPVEVTAAEGEVVTNLARVNGGGVPDASAATPTTISATPATFGVSPGGASTMLSSTQAGAHPDITTSIALNTVNAKGSLAGDPKDIVDDLPPGFAADLADTPTCAPAIFSLAACPTGTQIGITTLTLLDVNGERTLESQPVYNISPNPGEVAKFGFSVAGNFDVQGNVSVRPGDYGGRVSFHNTNESPAELDNASVTIWGVPASPVHDPWRFKHEGLPPQGSFGTSSEVARVPYFTNSTACGEPLDVKFSASSWQGGSTSVEMPLETIAGCDRLGFPASFTAVPTTSRTDAPTGLDVLLGVAQTYDNPEGLATATLKKAVVTLPEGMTVNPSAGAGLVACSQAQYEEEGLEIAAGKGCPSESKLGTVAIETPLLSEKAAGSVFLAQPYANPFPSPGHPSGSLLALYVVARFADRGVVVKVAGKVVPDEKTGRLVSVFEGTPLLSGGPSLAGLPPLPFSAFTFKFLQGPTSPLASPPACGAYAATTTLTPWSQPSLQLTPEPVSFRITQGFDGGACPSGGVAPFAPGVIAGTRNNTAAAYSPLDVRVTRNDGEQEITRFSSQLPPGLTANLTGVPFCSEAAIYLAKAKTGAQEEAEPSCPQASQIGHTLVGAGVGPVLAWAPGKVYMAGPYNGAPFSVVAITSAKVGPFDLGTVVVREALAINPETAAVTVDAKASDPIPHIIKGVVVHVRDIRVYIDRASFTLNPTSCAKMALAATVNGAGANFESSADDVPFTVQDPFQTADCLNLGFRPRLKVTTAHKTSRKAGASLSATLTYPKARFGTQTNIKAVKVDLPKQLPSRLSTLQRACSDVVFQANPASCPQASIVGHATAITPIVPAPLTGPAYFVSHGGAKFPELIIVLQGYGITIYLRAETFISKAGITSSTFRRVPDQPVTSFTLTLPQGPDSALAAVGNLCKAKLKMPTSFTAQNGMVIRQRTPIGVSGCPKHRAGNAAAGRSVRK
jgi:hypothetical protein